MDSPTCTVPSKKGFFIKPTGDLKESKTVLAETTSSNNNQEGNH